MGRLAAKNAALRKKRKPAKTPAIQQTPEKRGSTVALFTRQPRLMTLTETGVGGQNYGGSRDRIQRTQDDREAIVEEIMSPLQSVVGTQHESLLEASSRDKVSQRMLLEALTKVQQEQNVFERALFTSIFKLTTHVVNSACEEANTVEVQVADVSSMPENNGGTSSLPPSDGEAARAASKAAPKATPQEKLEKQVGVMADKMFAMMDTDKNDEISLPDAVNFVKKSGNAKYTPTEESIAAEYDANGNGMIDLEEFRMIVMDM
jgi:hypothetical protein